MNDYQDLQDYIIRNRRHLHKYPELGFNCFETHDYILNELKKLNIDVIPHVGKNSLIGIIKNGNKPIIGLRADFDALPIEEETDLEFKSVNKGVMHACGHDSHTGMLLGVAKYLSENKSEWSGTVKLIFQEAEEGPSPGGALGIVESGLVSDCDEFFALHVTPEYESGVIAVNKNVALASADTIKITLIGKGAHAAYPHLGIDPIIMQAELITSIQNIISRKLDPIQTGVITIAKVEAGTTHNIIPNKAYLEGTVRSFSPEVRKMFERELKKLVENITDNYGGSYEFEYIKGYDALVNYPESAKEFELSAKKILGDDKFVYLQKPSMGAEDFSKYVILKKGAMAWLGVAIEGEEHSIHHPNFVLNEKALINGALVLIDIVKRKGES